MKYIKPLTENEQITLKELLKHHTNARARTRAHGVLLSHRRYNLNAIADIYQVDRDTVSQWLTDWEALGVIGLYDDARSGRPPLLNSAEREHVNLLLKEEPRCLKRVAAQLLLLTQKIVSLTTLRRIAKQSKLVWKRIRTSLKSKRDEIAFHQAQLELLYLQEEQQAGDIDLYYFDESGFSLTPMIPYAWQPRGQTLAITPAKSQRLNVLGFFSKTNDFFSFIFQGRVDAQVVVACFEQFIKTLTKPTWIILDNAAQHTANLFKAKILAWEQQGLFIKYLPSYSPELNVIEILWRFIKYTWLPFSAYLNFVALKNALEEVLASIGEKYRIIFG